MNDGARMRDELRFTPPAGVLGHLLESRIKHHLAEFLKARNARIKQVAESEEWHRYLDTQPSLDLTPFFASV